MRKAEIRSMEDIKSMPFDRWIEVAEGFDVDFIDVEEDVKFDNLVAGVV